MKTAFFVFAFLIAVASAAKTKVKAVALPKVVCYKKVTKCCFKYQACGVKIGKIRVNAKCPFIRPAKKCIRVCKPKAVASKVVKCWRKLLYGAPKCLDHPWLPKVCVKIPYIKKICKTIEVQSAAMPCVKKCHPVKHIYVRPCYFFKVHHHPKFCPKLACAKTVTHGSTVKPIAFFGKVGKVVKSSKTRVVGPPIWNHKW